MLTVPTDISTLNLPMYCRNMLPEWEKPEMGCIMPVGGAPLAIGWGRGGGPDVTSGGDTPTGRGGRGRGGTAERGAAMGARGGMPGEEIETNLCAQYRGALCRQKLFL